MLYLPEIASHTFPERIIRCTRLAQDGWAVILEGAKEVILLDGKLKETNRINIEKWHPTDYKYSYWMDLDVSPDGQYLILSARDQVVMLDQQGQLLYRTQYAKKELNDHVQFVFTQDGLVWSVTHTPDDQTGHLLTLIELPAGRVVAQHTIHTPDSICYLCTHPFAAAVLTVISDHCTPDKGSQIYRVQWDGSNLSLVDYGVGEGAIYAIAPSGHEFASIVYKEDSLSFHDFKTGHLLGKRYLENLRPASEIDSEDEDLHISNISYLDDWRCLVKLETHRHYEYWLLDRISLVFTQQIYPARNLPPIPNLRQLWQQKDFTLPAEPWLFHIIKGATGKLLCNWSDNTLQLINSHQLLFPNCSGTNAPIPDYQLSLFDHEN